MWPEQIEAVRILPTKKNSVVVDLLRILRRRQRLLLQMLQCSSTSGEYACGRLRSVLRGQQAFHYSRPPQLDTHGCIMLPLPPTVGTGQLEAVAVEYQQEGSLAPEAAAVGYSPTPHPTNISTPTLDGMDAKVHGHGCYGSHFRPLLLP